MSLRARLWVGFAIIVGVLIGAGVLILTLQQAYLVDQIDTRLSRQITNAAALAADGAAMQGVAGEPRRARGLADLYIGVVADGSLTTLETPQADPGLTPVLDLAILPDTPTTVPAVGGTADQMRVVTAELAGDEVVVLGRSMNEIQTAMTGLRTAIFAVGAALLGSVVLVFWWMRRLGLDPILRVTRVARAITAGDTTQRVEAFPAGTEAHDLGTAFNQLVEANESGAARLRQFVADASHELRTPLVTLKGYAALHGAGGLADDVATDDAMRRIKQEANRMSRLVEELLLLTELDQGHATASTPVDLVPIVTDLAGDLQVLDPGRPVTVTAPQAAVVPGDRDRLAQVLAGLTSNALRHTPSGTPIDLRVDATADRVRVEVADHGPGIPPEDLPRVFDRFFRADAARARASGGSGLGLAIAAAIVRAHGGTVGVDSPPGKGATFWVELPTTTPLP